MYRNRISAVWLAGLLGAFGVQKFYVGRNTAGVLCFLFAFTLIPALLGIVDAILWLRMSGAQFERQYGMPMIEGLFPDTESAKRRAIRTMLLTTWKMIHILSWTVLPFFLIKPIGIAIPAALLWWFAFVLVMAVILPKIALRVSHPLIRYLLDPIGPELRSHHRNAEFEVWLQAVVRQRRRQSYGYRFATIRRAGPQWRAGDVELRYYDAPEVVASLATQGYGGWIESSGGWRDDDYTQCHIDDARASFGDSYSFGWLTVNPASGFPMIGGMGSIDTNGNTFGSSSHYYDPFPESHHHFEHDTFRHDDSHSFSSISDPFKWD